VHGHRELLLAVLARAAARAAARPAIVWHWHGPPLSLSSDRGSRAERALVRALSAACARVIAISPYCAEQARDMGVPADRIVTVVNAAAVPEGSPPVAGPLPDRAPGQITLLLACASLRAHKGVHLAVEALGELPGRYALWVTGDASDPVAAGYAAELRDRAARLGVSARLHFIGARRDVHGVMARSDLVLVPSTWAEPFGLVVVEAQLLGVPVVVSDRGALPELVGGGAFGAVFDPAVPGALAAAIRSVGEDPARRARLAEAARARARDLYSYARWSREVGAVLRGAAAA
jgi:glycosyltransferase involved in cell wall biosynthesis